MFTVCCGVTVLDSKRSSQCAGEDEAERILPPSQAAPLCKAVLFCTRKFGGVLQCTVSHALCGGAPDAKLHKLDMHSVRLDL